MKYVSREILEEKFNKKCHTSCGQSPQLVAESWMQFQSCTCVIYGENSRTWKIFLPPLQFFIANYHSTQAPYSYVIRF
jgi:hypothetical protein